MSAAPLIVGTAGHIDHGKTSLVRALTGVDLDRSPEEKARGITLHLGFTATTLPGGRSVSFVDVPGHERLVRTMIAGACGLDAALLCVSAVEGVMPQTREHLAILGLLGVQAGLVVLTCPDLVDEDGLLLARMDVEDNVVGTFLEGAPILAVASGPSPAGHAALLEALGALPVRGRPVAGAFRLPVDRAFLRPGFGAVVTGTVASGAVRDGEELIVQPTGQRARLRGLHHSGLPVTEVSAGQRAALNLAGVAEADLSRGLVVTRPGGPSPTPILDVELRLLPDAPALEDGVRVRLLIGTAEVLAVVATISAPAAGAELGPPLFPGDALLAQLRTEAPIVAEAGDRFVLRRESPLQTLGGGVVLDPHAPRLRRRDLARAQAELLALRAGDERPLLDRAGDLGLAQNDPRAAGLGAPLGDRRLHPERLARLHARLDAALAEWHAEHPQASALGRRELHMTALPQLTERLFDALVQQAAEAGRVELDGPRLRQAGWTPRLSPADRAQIAALCEQVRAAGAEAPRLSELSAPPPLVLLAIEGGALQRVGERVFHRDTVQHIKEVVIAHLLATGSLSAGDLKALLSLSRQHAIPLLEWLDAQRITQRQGDLRVLHPERAARPGPAA